MWKSLESKYINLQHKPGPLTMRGTSSWPLGGISSTHIQCPFLSLIRAAWCLSFCNSRCSLFVTWSSSQVIIVLSFQGRKVILDYHSRQSAAPPSGLCNFPSGWQGNPVPPTISDFSLRTLQPAAKICTVPNLGCFPAVSCFVSIRLLFHPC